MIPTIYEDQDILVIEKPVGLAIYPQKGSTHDSLAEHLAKNFPELKKIKDYGAAHRLDVETSGLVVFARNEAAYKKLRTAFSQNRVHKEYEALVTGTITKKGSIDGPIGPDPKSAKRVKVYRNLTEARRHKAQEAVTYYTPLTPSLLRIQITTGRRHQIRAHLAAIGHPIVGDKIYGGPPANRLYLHAQALEFQHPRDGKSLIFQSKICWSKT